jgi:hypothetical protein
MTATHSGLMDAYVRIDELVEARSNDYPRRVEPTWSALVSALEALAAELRAPMAGSPSSRGRPGAPDLPGSPVFIVGPRKSGTTLLLNLLDGHSQLVALPNEPHHFQRFLLQHGRRDRSAQLEELHTRWIHNLICPTGLPPFWTLGRPWVEGEDGYQLFTRRLYEIEAAHPDQDLLAVVAAALCAVATGAVSDEIRHWVVKTPGDELVVRRIQAVYPDASFVHILRDPRAVSAAVTRIDRAAGERADLETTAHDIRRSFDAAGANLRLLGATRYLVIRYEDLVRHPEVVMAEVARFLGIDFEEGLLMPTILGKPATSNSAWEGRRSEGRIDDSHLERWREELDEDSLTFVVAVTGASARRWGYTVPRVRLSPGLVRVYARRGRLVLARARHLLAGATRRKLPRA